MRKTTKERERDGVSSVGSLPRSRSPRSAYTSLPSRDVFLFKSPSCERVHVYGSCPTRPEPPPKCDTVSLGPRRHVFPSFPTSLTLLTYGTRRPRPAARQPTSPSIRLLHPRFEWQWRQRRTDASGRRRIVPCDDHLGRQYTPGPYCTSPKASTIANSPAWTAGWVAIATSSSTPYRMLVPSWPTLPPTLSRRSRMGPTMRCCWRRWRISSSSLTFWVVCISRRTIAAAIAVGTITRWFGTEV